MLQSYPQLRLSPFISSSRPLLDRISTEICIIRARNERTSGAKEIQQSYRRHSAFRHTLYHSFSFITMKTKKMLTAKQKEESRIRLTLLLTWIRIRIDSPESKERWIRWMESYLGLGIRQLFFATKGSCLFRLISRLQCDFLWILCDLLFGCFLVERGYDRSQNYILLLVWNYWYLILFYRQGIQILSKF